MAEVDRNQIRTYGDNFIHVSEIDQFVEYTPSWLTEADLAQLVAPISDPQLRAKLQQMGLQLDPPRRTTWMPVLVQLEPERVDEAARLLGLGEPEEHVKRIAEHVSTLIKDGDTIQIGVGSATDALPSLGVFDNRQDLGFHSELAVRGIAKLVKAGVITGKHKTLHPGRAVSGAFGVGADEEDLAFMDGNPLFEMYDQEYVNHPSIIIAHDNMVAINNAISVDLTGQINCESVFGPQIWNGHGGFPEFAIAALFSKGGRSIVLLPSTTLGGTVSRIVPLFEPGTVVTVPRTLADIIVTEWGIARLLGKSLRQRAEELIAIAHPDFRAELRKEAQRLFYP